MKETEILQTAHNSCLGGIFDVFWLFVCKLRAHRNCSTDNEPNAMTHIDQAMFTSNERFCGACIVSLHRIERILFNSFLIITNAHTKPGGCGLIDEWRLDIVAASQYTSQSIVADAKRLLPRSQKNIIIIYYRLETAACEPFIHWTEHCASN